MERFRTQFIAGGDANDVICQMRTGEHHDVGTTPGFGGDVEKALRSIKAPFLYMPSETICPRKRICIFRWRMRNTKLRLSRTGILCPFIPCGGIRLVLQPARKTEDF
jgi:hypothetical protein